ncbi:MAG: 16S rRNA (cytidine(1402)-2'-O)-methyltransferase [Ignavibacteria bacterium]|nr:16S rRNA (cytidine(1402)-2'-O)-methyltransferase [Ignavibacteria bacterium]
MLGRFYIVSTHIGNFEDIVLRAKRVLSECDFVICEELKPARQLLKQLELYKELIQINEHTEKENTELVLQLLLEGKNCCLISDAGTPLFSDPGNYLLNKIYEKGIPVSIVPGPDSLVPALIVSGFDISKFFYAGWLSPKSHERKSQLKSLKQINKTIAIMDTPYRLKQLLVDVKEIFGDDIKVSLACDLTTENEKILRGKISEVYQKVVDDNSKCEFVLIIDNSNQGS